MSVSTLQPIAGIPADREMEIEVAYPSVAAVEPGCWLGQVFGRLAEIENPAGRVLALLLTGAVLAPLAAGVYFWTKLRVPCYVLTTHSIQAWRLLGRRPVSPAIRLEDIEQIELVAPVGGAFHRAAHLTLLGKDRQSLLRLAGISNADRFRHSILRARDARLRSDEALRQIQSRGGP
jgi:hypothetical protein